MPRWNRVPFLPLVACALGALSSGAGAQIQAIDFTAGAVRYDFTPTLASWCAGYEFTTSADVTVYNLGFYDSGLSPRTNPGFGTTTSPDGFTGSHDIGIYNAVTGKLLVQATVPQDSTLLASNFRYAAQLKDANGKRLAAPYTLDNGGTYIIVGVSQGENVTYVTDNADISHALHVAYLRSEYQASDSLILPGTSDSARGYFGANFTTTAFPNGDPGPSNDPPDSGQSSNTPEPGPLALSAASLCVLGLTWRRRLRAE